MHEVCELGRTWNFLNSKTVLSRFNFGYIAEAHLPVRILSVRRADASQAYFYTTVYKVYGKWSGQDSIEVILEGLGVLYREEKYFHFDGPLLDRSCTLIKSTSHRDTDSRQRKLKLR